MTGLKFLDRYTAKAYNDCVLDMSRASVCKQSKSERENQVKSIKMLGLAALAALMAMAFVGASSAMAEETALCHGDGAGCIAFQHVHESTLAGKKAVLKTSIVTVECDALFLGDTLTASGLPLVIHGTFTYTNCGGCTATEENGPAEIKVQKSGHETGTVTGEGLVHVECSGLNCRYNGTGLTGTAKGPLLSTETNGEVSLVKQSTAKESGIFCPATSELTITTTPLDPVYLSNDPGFWCHDVAKGNYKDTLCLESVTPGTGLYEKEVV